MDQKRETQRARAADHSEVVGEGARVVAEGVAYAVVRGAQEAGPHVQTAAQAVASNLGAGWKDGVQSAKDAGIERHISAAAQAAAPILHQVGSTAAATACAVGETGIKGVRAGVTVVVENREEIRRAAQTVGRHGAQAGVVAVGCMGNLFGAAWNNAGNVIRPFCAQCEVGLTGGCGEWRAFVRPGCEHLICYDCQYKGQHFNEYAPCIKCYTKPKSKPAQSQGCFAWLLGKQIEPPPAEPDYVQGYVTTGDVVEGFLPELAQKIAKQYQLDEEEIFANMTDSSSKDKLSALAQQRLVPVLL